MRIQTLFITILILFFSIPSASYAISISCDPCLVNDCQCSITDCDNGTLDVYTKSDCSGIPTYTFAFSGGSKTWSPTDAVNYYLKILCDDSSISDCTSLDVKSIPTTTTTSENGEDENGNGNGGNGGATTTTTSTTTTSTTSMITTTTTITAITTTTILEEEEEEFPINWLIVIIIVIATVGIFVWFRFFRRSKEVEFETLKEKWTGPT